jgi:hypothetical protein
MACWWQLNSIVFGALRPRRGLAVEYEHIDTDEPDESGDGDLSKVAVPPNGSYELSGEWQEESRGEIGIAGGCCFAGFILQPADSHEVEKKYRGRSEHGWDDPQPDSGGRENNHEHSADDAREIQESREASGQSCPYLQRKLPRVREHSW